MSLALVSDLCLEPVELVLDLLLLLLHVVHVALALLESVLGGGFGSEGLDLGHEVGIGLLEGGPVRLELCNLRVKRGSLDGLGLLGVLGLGGGGGRGVLLTLAEPGGAAWDVEPGVGRGGGLVMAGRLRDEVGLVPGGGDVVGRTREHGDASEGGDADKRQSGERVRGASAPNIVRALALDQRGELVQQRTRLGGAHHG